METMESTRPYVAWMRKKRTWSSVYLQWQLTYSIELRAGLSALKIRREKLSRRIQRNTFQIWKKASELTVQTAPDTSPVILFQESFLTASVFKTRRKLPYSWAQQVNTSARLAAERSHESTADRDTLLCTNNNNNKKKTLKVFWKKKKRKKERKEILRGRKLQQVSRVNLGASPIWWDGGVRRGQVAAVGASSDLAPAAQPNLRCCPSVEGWRANGSFCQLRMCSFRPAILLQLQHKAVIAGWGVAPFVGDTGN